MHDTDLADTSPDIPVVPPRRRHRIRNFVALPLAGLAGLIIILAAALGGGGGDSTSSTATFTPAPQASSPAVAAPVSVTDPAGQACAALDAAGYCPGDDPAATGTPSASTPAVSTSRQQALDSARSYLNDGQGFSRAGLINQLHSQAGEGFSLADATWAADHSGADWNAQAVMSAKSYMNDGQGFSRAGLIEQLTSAYGEQFTLAQATYAVSKAGL
jgi:hypothetical protein